MIHASMKISSLLSKYRCWIAKRKQRFKRAPYYIKAVRIIGLLTLLFFVYLFIVDINLFWLFGKSPGLLSINNPNQNIASEIYSADGKLIGNILKKTEHRSIRRLLHYPIKTLVSTRRKILRTFWN
jgi:penicillin-binding protein 1A